MRVAFLDRDGTINVDHGYTYRIEDWQFTERAVEALQRLQANGFALAIVTNQSGVARGYYCLEDAERLHAYVRQLLREAGISFAAVALCPHASEANCDCRKPRTGMARQIAEQLGAPVDYAGSWTVGDKISDLEFGRALGTRNALIRSRYWQEELLDERPDVIADSLYDAACRIVDQAKH